MTGTKAFASQADLEAKQVTSKLATLTTSTWQR